MLFKIDENLPEEITEILNKSGYDAVSVYQQRMKGYSDSALYKVCQNENRILITLDSDFGDIRTYPPQNSAGIILIRVHNQSKKNLIDIVTLLMLKFERETIKNRLWIVEE